MPTRTTPGRQTDLTQTTSRPLRSYLLRVVEERTVHVAHVYELHDIASGRRRRFASLEALQRHLERQRRA